MAKSTKRKSDSSTSSEKKKAKSKSKSSSTKSSKPHALEGMTGSSFVKHAPKMTLQLSWEGISEEDLRDNRFSLAPKKFSTGSFGWGANAKLEGPSIVIGESAWDNVPVNMSANFTITKSKDLPPGTPSSSSGNEDSDSEDDEDEEDELVSSDEEEEKRRKKKSKGKSKR